MRFNFYLSLCLLCLTYGSKSQDTLKFKDGSYQLAKILEISETSIKYKKAEFPNGPAYVVLLTDVHSIHYLNGKKEVFTKHTVNGSQRSPENDTSPVSDYYIKPETVPAKKPYKKSGPRLGCTYIGEGTAATWITDQGKTPFVTQLGWEIEARIFNTQKNVACLAEFTFLLAGIEQGMLLPSGSVLLALRGREGLEMALGPNLSSSGLGMEFSVGHTLKIGDVYFPIHLSFVPSVTKQETSVSYTGTKTTIKTETGFRVNLLIAFYSKKK